MNEWIKKAFVSVEVVIVAGLILFTGLAGVTTMGMMGTSTMKSGLDKLDLLGLFSGGNSGGGEVETPVENNEPVAGYPEGLEILPGSINAEGDFTFEWDDVEEGWIVTAYLNNNDKNVVIPVVRADGYPIVKIGNYAFADMGLTSVVMPDTIVSIGANAFINNNLSSPIESGGLGFKSTREKVVNGMLFTSAVTTSDKVQPFLLPEDLMSIGESAFENNELTQLVFPEGIKIVSNKAFKNNQLTSLEIPSSLITLGTSAFESNVLTTVTFEGSRPTTFGKDIFKNNPTLSEKSVFVPSSSYSLYKASEQSFSLINNQLSVNPADVNAESDFVFVWDSTLNGWSITGYLNNTKKDVIIPNKRADGLPIVKIGDSAFLNKGLTSVNLPDSLKSLGSLSFSQNLLTTIVIPASLKTSGNSSFKTNNLTDITFLGSLPTVSSSSSNYGMFYQNPLTINSIKVYSDYHTQYVTNSSNYFSAQKKFITINSSDINVENGIAYVWDAVRNGWSVKSYPGYPNKNVVIPSTREDGIPVVSVSEGAFQSYDIESLVLNENMKYIGKNAFSYNKLTELTLPSSLIETGMGAFAYNLLNKVVFEGSILTHSGSGSSALFYDNPLNFGSILVPSEGYVNYYNISGNLGVTADKIAVNPSDANREGDFSYQWNASLAGWEIQGYFNEINKNVVIPSTRDDGQPVVSIRDNAFRDSKLTSVIFPNTIKHIGASAFLNNLITNLEIPASVTYIGTNAFYTNKLTSVKFYGKPTDLKSPTNVTVTGMLGNNATLLAGAIKVPQAELSVFKTRLTQLGIGNSDRIIGY